VTHVLESSGKLQAVSEGSDSSNKAIQAMSNNDIAVQDVGGRRAFSLAFFVSSKRGVYLVLASRTVFYIVDCHTEKCSA
jgi:hypothetical protein